MWIKIMHILLLCIFAVIVGGKVGDGPGCPQLALGAALAVEQAQDRYQGSAITHKVYCNCH